MIQRQRREYPHTNIPVVSFLMAALAAAVMMMPGELARLFRADSIRSGRK